MPEHTCGDCPHFMGDPPNCCQRKGASFPECPARTNERKLREVLEEIRKKVPAVHVFARIIDAVLQPQLSQPSYEANHPDADKMLDAMCKPQPGDCPVYLCKPKCDNCVEGMGYWDDNAFIECGKCPVCPTRLFQGTGQKPKEGE